MNCPDCGTELKEVKGVKTVNPEKQQRMGWCSVCKAWKFEAVDK